jgi:RNA polymerase sigma-54 factor
MKSTMLSQQFKQKQQQKLLPQQIELLNLFQLTGIELQQRISQELEDNPVLAQSSDELIPEEVTEVADYADLDEYFYDDIPSPKSENNYFFSSDQVPEKPIVNELDFREEIKESLRLSIEGNDMYRIATYLVDSLNEAGMLDKDLKSIAEEISFKYSCWVEEPEVLEALKIIQQMDPPGIGARDTRECLLLQLERQVENCEAKNALQVIRQYFQDLLNRNFDKILSGLNWSMDQLKSVFSYLSRFPFRPLISNSVNESITQRIVPDFLITVEDGIIRVSLIKSFADNLHINRNWNDPVQNVASQADKGINSYFKTKQCAAKWFLSAIQQREKNMLNTIKAISQWQREYFLTGDKLLIRPMVLKNIASIVGTDISTISRITSNKYVATPYGMILLKALFSEGIKNNEGTEVTSHLIQYHLKWIVKNEDKRKPHSDFDLASILSQTGFTIARRTIAKYRDQLGIPPAALRMDQGNNNNHGKNSDHR